MDAAPHRHRCFCRGQALIELVALVFIAMVTLIFVFAIEGKFRREAEQFRFDGRSWNERPK